MGIDKHHNNIEIPTKKTKLQPLTKEDKIQNKEYSKRRIPIEHIIGVLKRWRILKETYRNRRKRFRLRFNLIAGIYNQKDFPDAWHRLELV